MCGTTDVQKFAEAEQVLKKRPLLEETCEDLPLRSGKWTHEEERYAASLIEHFETGKLTDCEDGETLRAYLSRKLHCIPMRVSKKYAGQCIGKHAFRMASDASSYAQSLETIRGVFLESLSRKKMRNRKRKSVVKSEISSESETLCVTDNALSSDSCCESSGEEEDNGMSLTHSLSFPDFDSLGVSTEVRADGFEPVMPISIEDELLLDNGCDFDWIDELSDNM